jgi:hypothetical protein
VKQKKRGFLHFASKEGDYEHGASLHSEGTVSFIYFSLTAWDGQQSMGERAKVENFVF